MTTEDALPVAAWEYEAGSFISACVKAENASNEWASYYTVPLVRQSDALSAITLAQAERDTARQERDELRARLQEFVVALDEKRAASECAMQSVETAERNFAASELVWANLEPSRAALAPQGHPAGEASMTQAPAGWRLVPVELTPEMDAATSNVETAAEAWRAMLAAAPLPAAPAADRAVSELPALRQPMPDDLLTVANIESDGNTLTLEINQLGDLVHLIGEDERTCTLTIAAMRRADFDDLGDFDGF